MADRCPFRLLDPGSEFSVFGLERLDGFLEPLCFLSEFHRALFHRLDCTHQDSRHVARGEGCRGSDGPDAIVPEGGEKLSLGGSFQTPTGL